ncbi:hypothetical protein [Actinophytocola sp.]|uniref:hypothetical protein n=1 Tax=Actinophytocola sp. TaxID=1872138 RepID=UPI002ED4FF6C
MTSRDWTDPGSSFGVASTIFALTALPAGILFGTINGDLETGIIFGFLFGLAFAICMIPFLRTKRATLHFDNRVSFEQRLMVEMAALMYTPTVINDNLVHYDAPTTGVMDVGPLKNMSAAHLNRIAVHFDAASATVIGPRWMVDKVLGKLGGPTT